jgi:hypothetical protein
VQRADMRQNAREERPKLRTGYETEACVTREKTEKESDRGRGNSQRARGSTAEPRAEKHEPVGPRRQPVQEASTTNRELGRQQNREGSHELASVLGRFLPCA